MQVVTASGLAAKHTPASDYECEIAALLQEAGHDSMEAAAKVRVVLWLLNCMCGANATPPGLQ